jgi:hypothetical protein
MDNLFLIRTLTTAVNAMVAPSRRIYNRLFQGKENMQGSDRLAFDIITGSEGILGNIAVNAPATVDKKVGVTTVTMTAPRIANKRMIATADLNAARQWGQQLGLMQMEQRIGIEQRDMRNKHDRTLEWWAAGALKGYIYDSDLTTLLVDYGLDATHRLTLTGDDLFTSPNSNPIIKLRTFKTIIEEDSGAVITGWLAYLGSEVMDALIIHPGVIEWLKTDRGAQIAENGRIERMAGIEMDEYNASFVDDNGTRRQFINSDEIVLIGLCDDLVDMPFAPVVDDDAPNGVGNITFDKNGSPVPALFFSKSWKVQDPSGRWIKVESRPLPVLKRAGAVITATVV